jgi:valyl-tRNA synthetase
VDPAAEDDFALVQDIVTRIRDARKEAKVEPAKRVQVILAGAARAPMLKQQSAVIEQLARTEPPRIERKLASRPEQAMALVAGNVEVYLPLAGMLDLEKEAKRLDGEIAEARKAIERSEAKLANEQFVTRARPDVVQKERDSLDVQRETLAKLEAQRRELTT